MEEDCTASQGPKRIVALEKKKKKKKYFYLHLKKAFVKNKIGKVNSLEYTDNTKV
jgi:hypothetical protein